MKGGKEGRKGRRKEGTIEIKQERCGKEGRKLGEEGKKKEKEKRIERMKSSRNARLRGNMYRDYSPCSP